ncbi:protein of unknown function [Algoriphagus alkaliphilus]|uniref:DUF4221 domain-containing protein n=1 Tax=Algoriphagus alkaliphilus TaxID=279824 RepID=A0A1G5WT33_9BACT|nr:DUF4221 family protein [Algoriphagus alkaliphilus]SDA60465.1 protein of unknown function [Algoriphagus alkaliphilus]
MHKFNPNFVFSALFSLLLFSCQKQGEDKSKVWELVPSAEKISLSLDDQTPNISMRLEYFGGKKPLLFNVNEITNSLQIFDLESQSLVKELTFEREGDQGVDFQYFHVQSLDSIFLFPPFGKRIILTDTSGKIKNRIRFELPLGYSTIFPHNSYYVSPPAVIGKDLIVKTRADGRITEFTQSQLDTLALEVAINLETGAVRMLPLGFPGDYLNLGNKQLEYSIVNQGGKKLVSFMGDHRVYLAEQNSEIWSAKDAKSQFLDEQMPFFAKDVDSRGINEYAFSKSRYESLVYDPYRKVYYRFAYPTVTFETDEELRALRTSPGPFVVIVLDENGDILTERRFEAGTYYPTNFFVGEKGLYLSINHPDNPENQEDVLTFELIRLNK